MPHDVSLNSTLSLELALLRAICASSDLSSARGRIVSGLTRYKWHDPDHAIVFAALGRIHDRDKRPLREQLRVVATRMGFPDIDWENYFVNGASIAEEELLNLVRKVTAPPLSRK